VGDKKLNSFSIMCICYHNQRDLSTRKCVFLGFIWKCGIFATVFKKSRIRLIFLLF
jgi:hypothetical protein